MRIVGEEDSWLIRVFRSHSVRYCFRPKIQNEFLVTESTTTLLIASSISLFKRPPLSSLLSLIASPFQLRTIGLHPAISFQHQTCTSQFLLVQKLTCTIVGVHMCPKTALKYSGAQALEGVHGVHVDPHSPFSLTETDQNGRFHSSTCGASFFGSNHLLSLQQAWQQRPACLRPINCCINGDRHLVETVANVVTSLPFIALGCNAPRKDLNSKMYANSLIGVGMASSMYHCSRGKLRRYLRWVDYTMIATATVCLSRAVRNENSKMLMAATAVFLPVQPLMVSVVHTGMMEVAFAKRALKDPDLRMAHNVHKLSSLLGGVLFIADDLFPEIPYIHAAWHLAAAVGVGTCNKLLE